MPGAHTWRNGPEGGLVALDAQAMNEFLAAVRKASLPAVWAKGVRLAESRSPLLEERSDDEAVFRVRVPERRVPTLTVLDLAETDWTCDCDAKLPCEHVVAAAIALKSAPEDAEAPQRGDAPPIPRLAYRLLSTPPSVTIQRVLVAPSGEETPLPEPLTRLLARHADILTRKEDLDVERILLAQGQGRTRASESRGLGPEGFSRLIAAWSVGGDVTLDGKPIEAAPDALLPRARLSAASKEGGRLRLEVEGLSGLKVLDRGLALYKGALRPLGAVNIAGARWERLPLVREIGPEEIAEFVTDVLPGLERELFVDIPDGVLPGRDSNARPRIHFDLTPQGHTLSVLPTLVYGDPAQIRIDGDKVVHLSGAIPKRTVAAEKELCRRLKDELSLIPGRVSHFDGGDAARFAKRLQAFQASAASSVSREVVTKASLVPELRMEGSKLEIRFLTEEEQPREARAELVFQAFEDRLDMVPLLDGGWAPLPADWLSRYGDKIQEILAARNPKGEVPLYAMEGMTDVCEELGLPVPREAEALRRIAQDFDSIPEAPVPEQVPVTLRSYQRQGLSWLMFLQKLGLGAVLADDMGLGKTLQALCALSGKALVICPKTVVFNWAQEIARFRPDLSVNVYHGPRRTLTETDVTLTTFAVLRMDEEILKKVSWDQVVFDEAQAIKNPESQLARSAFALSDSLSETSQRIALSGTPIENRLDEMWSIFRFTHPGLLGARREFARRYAEPIERGDPEARQRLKRLVKPFLLRRLKRDVLSDLPARTDIVLTVELEQEERDLYDAIFAMKRKEVQEALQGSGGGIMAALEALLRLRQAACHVGLLPGQERSRSSKVEALMARLEEAEADGHKCIVFSQWTSFLDLVEPELKARNIGFVRLDGSTENRGAVVEKFQAEDGPPVFLSSLKAGGTGLNLTAADHVFLLDPWWNPAAEDQAADRAHRIGQLRAVTVYRLIAKDTIEEGILALQSRKRELSEAILDEGGASTGITKEDLLALFEAGA